MAQPVLFKLPGCKVIFIATPKAGNTSILHALQGVLPSEKVGDGKTVQSRFVDYAVNRSEAYSLRSDHFIFSIVRNPWDRVVSHYSDKVCGGKDLHGRLKPFGDFYHDMPFEAYLDVLSDKFSDINDVHVQPQANNFFYRGAFLPNFVLRYEYFERDFLTLKHLLERCDVQLGGLERKNKSKRKPYRQMYSDKAYIQLVRKLYQKDVRFFGYSFK